jgi:Transposase DDE domain
MLSFPSSAQRRERFLCCVLLNLLVLEVDEKKARLPFSTNKDIDPSEGNLAVVKKSKAREKQKLIRKARRIQRKADENKSQIQDVLKWLIDENIFAKVELHGNTSWQCSALVCMTLLWVWSSLPQLTEAFMDARAKAEQLRVPITITTYQGHMKALVSSTQKLMPVLQRRLHDLMNRIGGKYMRHGKWVVIAVDGSKETVPRTLANEARFRSKTYGQGKNAKHRKRKNANANKASRPKTGSKGNEPKKPAKPTPLPPPQVWLTMMWHVGLKMPWCWKTGPSNETERAHVKYMLEIGHFLLNTLFVGDAGFVGHEFWKKIIDCNHDFLVRVGANVNLLTGLCEYQGDGKDIVYCWPETAMHKKQSPLRLRLVKCKIGKNEKVWLLTSVLDKQALTNKDMVRIYKERWGVEIQFRALKQTFNRRKLRCRSPERVLAEIEWSVFGMAAAELMALKEQLKNVEACPEKLSFAQALTVIRHSLNNLTDRPDFMSDFRSGLRNSLIDSYDRKKLKEGRYKPTRKKPPTCGEPKVRTAMLEEIRLRQKIDLQNAA